MSGREGMVDVIAERDIASLADSAGPNEAWTSDAMTRPDDRASIKKTVSCSSPRA